MKISSFPQADKSYKVAQWGVGSAQSEGDPVWDVVEQYLKGSPIIKNHTPNVPRLIGLGLNPGFANVGHLGEGLTVGGPASRQPASSLSADP
jgi:hypothetical protein